MPTQQQFDDDVPIPTARANASRFHSMGVGQSFLGTNSDKVGAASFKHRHPGWDYTSQVEGDGVRIWRTA